MNNLFLGRFKKKDKPLIEDEVPILEDRIFWVLTLQKIALRVPGPFRGARRPRLPGRAPDQAPDRFPVSGAGPGLGPGPARVGAG